VGRPRGSRDAITRHLVESKSTVRVGDVFSRITVMGCAGGYYDKAGHWRNRVIVRCECGREYIVATYNLTRKTSHQCRFCAHQSMSNVRIGDRFDRLVVEGFDRTGKRRMAICRCDCGSVVKRRACIIQNNLANSCGCRPRGSWAGVGELSGTFMHRLRRNAFVRNIEVSVAPEFLWNLYLEQDQRCALTGLSLTLTARDEATTASVDRIDSARDYVEDNVQWVHKDINLMKMDLGQEEFIALCQLVTKHHALK
jgi:hypothetical protein